VAKARRNYAHAALNYKTEREPALRRMRATPLGLINLRIRHIVSGLCCYLSMLESITQLMQHLALIQYINTGMHFLTWNFKMIRNLKFKTVFPLILACLIVRVSCLCYTRYSEINPMTMGGGVHTPLCFF